ncbi:isoprenyl transferase [Psychrobacillus lasiicapitis]|uniref:Isoprenyl transferase n=1 Tax=Psychrobacillus lasiicapitis TaxID=1636719 RepID=A0A544TF33_9BACI|nr:isoprenyl transferase [Psychrobacillus lasiicapitis]TQR16072.1 isoprenyl transferase [Psychrobacillus lasiicapitis]GGA15935.1 isoprenyl transferase [Psychrobacillus lasiicapitis]
MLNKLIRKSEKSISIPLGKRKENAQQEQLPGHIAIIMDGNGRWAKKRALPRIAGHHEGMKTVKKITRFANEVGIKVLTLYAFSTENWKRPKMEVEFLMRLPEEFLGTYLPELIEQNVQVQMMGNIESLPEHTKRAVQKAIDQTATNDGLILNFALNYGSRDEIVQAVSKIARDVQEGNVALEEISEALLSNHLMTKNLSEPDLLIRTSGEVRLSNFMLWQLAYTEFWFTDTLWPDFDESCLMDAIENYQKRNRRYGGLKEGEGN